MHDTPRFTWDGLPIAPDEPHGAAIMVRRYSASSRREYLVLHRGHHGPGYEGDWAWTPPSGSRQPGEPVLAAALRELAEETGLHVAREDVRVLDLSGDWVRFGLDVRSDTVVSLDAEHDRFEWLTAADAISRCQPADVARGIRQAEWASAVSLSFRPLAMADLPNMLDWQHAPHAVRWFPECLNLAAAERKYAPRIAGASPVHVHVVAAAGRDCGFAQNYPVGNAVGIDYNIGREELTGCGLGPQLIWNYLRDIAVPAHPAATKAVASPDAANQRSIRALEKAGFRRLRDVDVDGEATPQQLCVLDLARFFG